MTTETRPAVEATWALNLFCECPGCKQDVDLLDSDDFWEGRKIAPCEHGTERTRNMRVSCPNCGHEFHVRCVY